MTYSWMNLPTPPWWNWSSLETAHPLVSRTYIHSYVIRTSFPSIWGLISLWWLHVYVPSFNGLVLRCLQTSIMSKHCTSTAFLLIILTQLSFGCWNVYFFISFFSSNLQSFSSAFSSLNPVVFQASFPHILPSVLLSFPPTFNSSFSQ